MTESIETQNLSILNSIDTFQNTMTQAIEKRSVERNNILYGIPAGINPETGEVIP
jgi:hypothetical protein